MTQATKTPNASRMVAAFNHRQPGPVRASDPNDCWRQSHKMADPHGRIALSEFIEAAQAVGFVVQPVQRGVYQIAWQSRASGKPIGYVVEP